MSIIVTGATGHLGRLTVEALLQRGVPAHGIVATGRHTDKIKDMAERGVVTRTADFDDPAGLRQAFDGADRILLVSSSENGRRVPQHRAVIDAATTVGVELLVYTSMVRASSSTMLLAPEHAETEALLREADVPSTVLRNGWYLENYTDQLPVYLQHGAVVGAAGEGRVSAATRADLAEAAAVVLTSVGDGDTIYELGGDEAFTLGELAGVINDLCDESVAYSDVPAATYQEILLGAGLPQPMAEALADADLGIGRGELLVESGDLSRLLGRPTTSMRDAVHRALQSRGLLRSRAGAGTSS